MAKKKARPQVPEEILPLQNLDNLAVFLRNVAKIRSGGKDVHEEIHYETDYGMSKIKDDSITICAEMTVPQDVIEIENIDYRDRAVYFDIEGNGWVMQLWTYNYNNKFIQKRVTTLNGEKKDMRWIDFHSSVWEPIREPLYVSSYRGYFRVNTKEHVENILKNVNPYGYRWYKETGQVFAPELLITVPCIEILSKAGYAIAKTVTARYMSKTEADTFKRLCQLDGKNPKEIFKTTKTVYTLLKDKEDLMVWDNIRKLANKPWVTNETISEIIESDFNEMDLANAYEILRADYGGMPVFTFRSLCTYLDRIDLNEAICRDEGLILLRDYLRMCKQLDMRPRIDGDSLKREHDVTARLVREKRDEETAKQMQSACDQMQELNYEEDIFFVRGIRDYDDLVSEARQQHNCVVSYAGRIAKGQSLIYVLREKKNPDKSLVTIELDPGYKHVCQKFMAYNRPVRNKAINDFIERWMKKIMCNENKKTA